MAGPHRRLRLVLGLVVGVTLALGTAAHPPQAEAREPWDGSINLYRSGVFTTQKTWTWCTAAGVQIMRNMVRGQEDHSKASQQRYFDYMRRHNRYRLPLSAGVDPAGWTAGLRRFVDDRYRLQSHATMGQALRLAVIRMRKTELPVGITVARGNHAWILHGFTATADPLKTSDFRITSVRVTGPLWGRQNSTFGYDMRPNKKLTVSQLRTFFTKWWYAPKRMIWDGRYVSIQPVTPSRSTTMSTSTSRATGPAEVTADTPSMGRIAATTGALLSWSSWRWKSTRAPDPHR
jgi:hypothetical protein